MHLEHELAARGTYEKVLWPRKLSLLSRLLHLVSSDLSRFLCPAYSLPPPPCSSYRWIAQLHLSFKVYEIRVVAQNILKQTTSTIRHACLEEGIRTK